MIKGDKIKLVRPMGAFTNVGEVCEVTDIRGDGSIWFRFGGVHLGCMSYDEYEKYFKPIKEKVKREWSEWKDSTYNFDIGCYILNNRLSIKDAGDLQYRSNGKRIQVRTYLDGNYFRASSTCCDRDTYDFYKGMSLAVQRLFVKIISYITKRDAQNM